MTTTEARKHLPELVNMAAYGHVTTVLTRDGRRLARIVPEEDAWVYSPAWQESSAKPARTLPRAACMRPQNGSRPIVIARAGSYGKVFVWKSRGRRFRLGSGPGLRRAIGTASRTRRCRWPANSG